MNTYERKCEHIHNVGYIRCVVCNGICGSLVSLRPSQRLASGRALLAVPQGAVHALEHQKKGVQEGE